MTVFKGLASFELVVVVTAEINKRSYAGRAIIIPVCWEVL